MGGVEFKESSLLNFAGVSAREPPVENLLGLPGAERLNHSPMVNNAFTTRQEEKYPFPAKPSGALCRRLGSVFPWRHECRFGSSTAGRAPGVPGCRAGRRRCRADGY